MCLYPKLIKNRKYIKNKKNGGNIPEMKDPRVQFVPVGCGNCMECRKQKSRQWQVRLHEEIRHNKTGKFVTLSFSDESLIELGNSINGLSGYNLDNEIATLAVRRFLERWRKKFKKSCRHWLITELGQKCTERIHLHGLLFTEESEQTIQDIWKYGNVFIGEYVSERTINYIVKYVNKIDAKHPLYKSKILTSHGIGKQYMSREDSKNNLFNRNGETIETYKTRKGFKMSLPIYYRNHLYNEEERELLWLQKLDKQERWVNGVRIDVSTDKGMEDYERSLRQARITNKEFGFGDDTVDKEKRRYENAKRNKLKLERLQKQYAKKNRNNNN